MIKRMLFASALLALLCSCASSPEAVTGKKHRIKTNDAKQVLLQMTTEEKVAQLFFITPEQIAPSSKTKVSADFVRTLERYPVGGIILFGYHIQNPSQLRAFTSSMQKASAIPLAICVDEEGGLVARLARSKAFFLPVFKNMHTVGDTGEDANARGAGQIIGSYLAAFGFTFDFAPVADVNTNPDNVVIGSRAFGREPALVSRMDRAFLSGLHSTGIKGCLKHFPGHGDTKGDTHADYVAVTKSWQELMNCELIPFVQNFDVADSVMVAHVTCTAVDDEYPASLSKKLITDKLRTELGYDGLVLTDALNMGAIEKNYGSAKAAVLAFAAGNDILLMPKDFESAYRGVLEAVTSGKISMQRLDESVTRILKMKGFL
ncbi:MAG: glycoside hydrolase family 3 protein [Treponema sp.]|nr:glycoside hydrolase family 3 protein [Treponema sp.]